MRSSAVSKIQSSIIELISSLPFRQSSLHFLLAVSGGADSVAMLFALEELRKKIKFNISVVTVNHNIREAEESLSDSLFVEKLCKNFCPPVPCIIAEIPEKKVVYTAAERKKGLEEAARFLRYAEFKKVCNALNCDFIFTAHTKNDFYETVLMRIFKGAASYSVLGIAKKRGKYFRPMLEVTRSEVESFLKLKNVLWREDSTNASPSYLRNKIRISLLHVLDEIFCGWRKGLDKTLAKIALDEAFVSNAFNSYLHNISYWQSRERTGGNEVFCKAAEFDKMPDCFKMRFLQEGFIALKLNKRISFSSIKKFINTASSVRQICASGIIFEREKEEIILKPQDLTPPMSEQEKYGYMVWVKEEEEFSCIAGSFRVKEKTQGFFLFHENDKDGIGPFSVPFCIRSRLNGDSIQISKRTAKTVKRVLSEWTENLFKRAVVPIIEEKGRIIAVYGKAVGLENLYACQYGGDDAVFEE